MNNNFSKFQVWSLFLGPLQSRYFHSCALIRNNILGSQYPNDIIVLGGLSDIDSKVLSSTEIYKSDLGSWERVPDFPTPIYGAKVVQYESDIIYAFGGATENGGIASDKIYSLSKSNLATWELVGQMNLPRYAHLALSVPRNLVQCQEIATESDEMVQESEQMVTESNEMVTESDEMVTESAKIMTESDDMVTESVEMMKF